MFPSVSRRVEIRDRKTKLRTIDSYLCDLNVAWMTSDRRWI